MIGKRLYINLLWRVVLLIATSLVIALVATRMLEREFVFTIAAGIFIIAIQIYYITSYVMHVNKTLTAFIDRVGLKSAEELRYHEPDSGFPSLESRLNQLKSEVSQSRFEVEKSRTLLDIVVGTMDTGLICINQEQEVVFSNHTAESILMDTKISNMRELKQINPDLANDLHDLKDGSSRIIRMPDFRASIRCRHFELDKKKYYLYSIQNIQREVDAHETDSWQKLIRVLTHEIMNSIGPILSLSKSLKNSAAQPEKIISGLSAIENTGDRLVNFITEYRKLTSLPLPEKTVFGAGDMLEQMKFLYSEECIKNKIELKVCPVKEDLKMEADKHQVEQILVNLVKNSIDSLKGSPNGIIELKAYKESEAAVIQVTDNGPGIPDEIREQIFVPFYTTRLNGSGIGLSLSRQIMTNHNGTIGFTSIPDVKTVFTLRF